MLIIHIIRFTKTLFGLTKREGDREVQFMFRVLLTTDWSEKHTVRLQYSNLEFYVTRHYLQPIPD